MAMENNTSFSEERKDINLERELPFVPRRIDDWSGWIYDHRYGITISIFAYLIFTFLFLSVRIPLHEKISAEGIFIDLEKSITEIEQLMEQERELREAIAQNDPDYFREIQNLISNDGSETEAAEGDNLMPQAAQMSAEASALAERLSSSRDAYQEGLASAQEILNTPRGNGENTEQADRSVRQRGDVTVRYSLEGRHDTYLHIPAYQCEGGGEVIINILVNRSGVVTSASAAKGSPAGNCLIDMAVKAASSSRFNADQNAPDKQQGTITYIFIPQ